MDKIFKSFYAKAFVILFIIFTIYSLVLTTFEEPITKIDLRILLGVRDIFSWLPASIVIAITDFGFSSWFLPAYTFAFGYTIAKRQYLTISVLAVVYMSFATIIHSIKDIFHRDRPDVLLHRVAETGFSYPSGHSTTAFYIGIVALFLISKNITNIALKRILQILLLAWLFVIPFTRVWLGVHYPSDVLGGAICGTMLACFTLTFIHIEYKED